MQDAAIKLQNQMEELFDNLGIDFHDVFEDTLESTQKIYKNLKNTRVKLSKLAAALSAVVIQVRMENKDGNALKDLRDLGEELGNLQFIMDSLIKKYKKLMEFSKDLMLESINLGEQLFKIQQKCVNIFKYNELFKDAKIKGFNY